MTRREPSRILAESTPKDRTFGYDGAHRLTSAKGPWGGGIACGGVTYTYDKNGNRLCKGEPDGDGTTNRTNYTYPATNNRLSGSTGAEPASYSYDADGNITGDGIHSYQYSQANRLANVDSGGTATYTYDGDGRRVIKLASTQTTYYFYDDSGRLLTEMATAPRFGKDYLYLQDAPIARVDWATEADIGSTLRVVKNSSNVRLDWTLYSSSGNTYVIRRKQVTDPNQKTFGGNIVLATVSDPASHIYDDPVFNDGNRYDYQVYRRLVTNSLYFYHTDHLGTPIAMTGSSPVFWWRAEHLPFGGIYSLPVSTIDNNLRFPGQYADGESGLYQNWHRDYAPFSGRYYEPDPIGLRGGIALYLYAADSPTRNTDLNGLRVQRCCAPADILLGLVPHCWLKTDQFESGMGNLGGNVPGDDSDCPYVRTQVVDHSKARREGVTCVDVFGANEKCVDQFIKTDPDTGLGRETGRFFPPFFNTCQTFVNDVLNQCRNQCPAQARHHGPPREP